MPFTRKQAWRRVRIIRHDVGEIKDKISLRYLQPQQQPRQEHKEEEKERSRERSGARRSQRKVASDDAIPREAHSTESNRDILNNWRLPKEGRDPSTRPGVSAARRQARAACVRVGSRVSFNTVVAAILIPSAKDLHASARQELWWQETDYREFRINFIQFMRAPKMLSDESEMAAANIVAESSGTSTSHTSEEQKDSPLDVQPVFVSAVPYTDTPCLNLDPRKTEDVQAWAVEEPPLTATCSNTCSETLVESHVEATISSAAFPASSDVDISDTETLPLTSPEVLTVPNGLIEEVSVADGSSTALPPVPCDKANYAAGGDNEVDGKGLASNVGVGDCWDDQDSNRRVEPSLSWSSTDSFDSFRDGDDNSFRTRRAFSNLETARRLGAVLDSELTSDVLSEEFNDTREGKAKEGRPRALSLDGWFTCGLESDVCSSKSYETHDHAGRHRDLVKWAPLPTVRTLSPQTESYVSNARQVDITEVLERLRVTFDVNDKNRSHGAEGKTGDTSDGDDHVGQSDAAVSFPASAAAVTAR